MERRSEERLRANQPVTLTVLAGLERSAPGLITDASGRGLRVVLREPVAAGAAVRIDLAGYLALGEVCYCRREGERFAAGIVLEQGLALTAQLLELRDSILRSMPDRCASPTGMLY